MSLLLERSVRAALPPLAVRLRAAIIEGEYAAGQRLSEAVIAAELGVSRNTLRESFQVLAQQGLLVRIPNRGVSVAAPGVADVVDLYRGRRVMELGALASVVPGHPAGEAMRGAVIEAQRASGRGDWRRVGTANMRFHEALVALSDSPRLAQAFGNVLAELRLAFLRVDDPELLHGGFVSRNSDILAALNSEDREYSCAQLSNYLDDSERWLLSAYSRLGLN